jgi:hypothetical protein
VPLTEDRDWRLLAEEQVEWVGQTSFDGLIEE